jgi:hypothetical protein
MTWQEKASDSTTALRYAILSGGTWSEPRTIVERNDFFVNWARLPLCFRGEQWTRHGALATAQQFR